MLTWRCDICNKELTYEEKWRFRADICSTDFGEKPAKYALDLCLPHCIVLSDAIKTQLEELNYKPKEE